MLTPILNQLCISSAAAKAAKKLSILGITIVLMINILVIYGSAQPVTVSPKFSIERIFTGHFEPSSMTFLASNDILVLDRDAGKVYRVTNGDAVPILDVNVGTDGYRGLLGVVAANVQGLTRVLLYYTQARTHDGDDATKNPVNPLGNRLYRYDLVDKN